MRRLLNKFAPDARLPKGVLDDNTDYLFCPVCRAHIPCRRVPSGGWEVECPGCAGECAFCHCHLRRFCFGTREQFPPFNSVQEK